MKRKKIIATMLGIVLAADTAVPGASASSQEETKAAGAYAELEEKAVTDYSKYENGELIVIYKEGASKKEKQQASSGIDIRERTQVADFCDKITLEEEGELETAVGHMAESEDVLYIQPNFRYQSMGTVSSAEDISGITEGDFAKQWWIYNDGTFEEPEEADDGFWPSYGGIFWPFSAGQDAWKQDLWDWGALLPSAVKAAAGVDTNTAKVWKQFSGGGRKTLVAVIDTGIDYTHSQLKDSMWVNHKEIPGNGIDDDGNGYIDDVYGWDFYYGTNEVYAGTSKIRGSRTDEDEHGTHIAGIIAAAKDGTGTVGIASNTDVELMSLKVLGGKDGSGDTESIVKAIAYAEEQGAQICNMSFGIGESDIPFYMEDYDQAMKEAVRQSSMLFVTAAGNEGSNNDTSGVFPGSYDFENIIAVGSLRCDGTLSEYSNYGMETVDLAAPGMYIYSTLPEEQYGYMSGSSMAAPMVTAACAMGYAYAKNPDVLAVRERILANVTKNSQLAGKVSTGGMLNVYDAVKDLAEQEYRDTGKDTLTENESSKKEENSENSNNANETVSDDVGDNKDTNSSMEDIKNETIDAAPEVPSDQMNPIDQVNVNDANLGQDISENVIGTKFIQDGIIYRIVSSSTAEAIGAEDSIAKKLVIKANVIYQSKSYKVVKIKEKAFYKNQSVKQVTVGKNVKTIGKSAFIGCKKLQKVNGMEAVEEIQKNAFKNCKKLKSIKLTENVNTIASSAFQGCNKLKVKVVRGSYAADFVKKREISVNYF